MPRRGLGGLIGLESRFRVAEVVIALVLQLLVGAALLAHRGPKTARWAGIAGIAVFVLSVALLRDGVGQLPGYGALLLLAVVWAALRGRRDELWGALAMSALVLFAPIVAIGPSRRACAAVRDLRGVVTERQATIRLVEERARMQRDLQRNVQQFRALVRNVPAGFVLLFDRDLRYLIADGPARADFGLKAAASRAGRWATCSRPSGRRRSSRATALRRIATLVATGAQPDAIFDTVARETAALFDLTRSSTSTTFKRVNDLHDHQPGDAVLAAVARCLSAQARASDLVARIGGEEFAWLMPETTCENAHNAAERARASIGDTAFEGVGAVTGLRRRLLLPARRRRGRAAGPRRPGALRRQAQRPRHRPPSRPRPRGGGDTCRRPAAGPSAGDPLRQPRGRWSWWNR